MSRRLWFYATPEMEARVNDSGISPALIVETVFKHSPELIDWAIARIEINGFVKCSTQDVPRCSRQLHASTTATKSTNADKTAF